jgi:HEAT repeat protein
LSYLDDDEVYLGTEIMVHGVVWALGRIGETHSDLGKGSVDALVARLGDEDLTTRGAAVVALGRIGDARAKEALLSCVDDERVVERYVEGEMRLEALGVMARGALERLRG